MDDSIDDEETFLRDALQGYTQPNHPNHPNNNPNNPNNNPGNNHKSSPATLRPPIHPNNPNNDHDHQEITITRDFFQRPHSGVKERERERDFKGDWIDSDDNWGDEPDELEQSMVCMYIYNDICDIYMCILLYDNDICDICDMCM